MKIRFTEETLTILLRQQRSSHGGRLALLRQQEIGMQMQNRLPDGKVNVRYRIHDFEPWSYRTFADKDVVEVPE